MKLLAFLRLAVAVAVADALNVINPPAIQHDTRMTPPLVARQQREGDSCSPDGLWNCMTTSFQRCAGGLWSDVVPTAEYTKCMPSGEHEQISIEYINGPPPLDDGDGDDDNDRPPRPAASKSYLPGPSASRGAEASTESGLWGDNAAGILGVQSFPLAVIVGMWALGVPLMAGWV